MYYTVVSNSQLNTPSRILLLVLLASMLVAAAQPTHDHVLAFDVQQSKMTVYVYKQGIFAFAADNHEVNVPITSGSFEDTTGTVELTIDATKMQVLDPQMPSSRRDKVQANMVGSQVLDVGKYPTISFRSTKIDEDDSGHLTVAGDLTLHGQTHAVVFQVAKIDPRHFTGSAMIRQTMFGITPIRILGGTVRVKDDVKVSFDIALS